MTQRRMKISEANLFISLYIAFAIVLASPVWGQQDYDGSSGGDQQVCPGEDGVCFANEQAAAAYYEPGRKVEIDFGEAQQVAGEKYQDTLDVIRTTKEYIAKVRTDDTFLEVRKECKCRNELCSFWAAIGELHFSRVEEGSFRRL